MKKEELLLKLGYFIKLTTLNKNQYVLYFENGEILYSYCSIICIKIHNDKIYLTNEWNYSKTTGKYRNQYLQMNKKEIEKQIKNNIIWIIT